MKLRKHERLYSEKELVGYLRYSGGAIEVHETYVVFYKNFLPLSKFVKGRSSIIINYSDIKSVEYRGCGWFQGWFSFSFKHFLKPLRFMFYRNHFLFLLKRSNVNCHVNRSTLSKLGFYSHIIGIFFHVWESHTRSKSK